MSVKKEVMAAGLVVLVVIAIVVGGYSIFRSPWGYYGEGPIKIFHLNSYHYGMPLVDEDIAGFESVFNDANIEIKVEYFQMDGLRNSSEENLKSSAARALVAIEEFGPDLIYATDDPAHGYIIKPYFKGSSIPVVFAAINKDLGDYGYDEVDNVAGVYERLPFIEVMDLLKQLYPYSSKIVLVTDNFPQWIDVIGRFKNVEDELPWIEFVGWETYDTFEEYKSGVLEYRDKVDAFVFLGLNTFEGEGGNNVPRAEVVRWNVENIDLPDVSFWNFLVAEGVLMAEEISSTDQGIAAGKIAYDILIEGEIPGDFSFMKTTKLTRHINLARAEKLDLRVPSIVLVNSEIVEEFSWEKSSNSSQSVELGGME